MPKNPRCPRQDSCSAPALAPTGAERDEIAARQKALSYNLQVRGNQWARVGWGDETILWGFSQSDTLQNRIIVRGSRVRLDVAETSPRGATRGTFSASERQLTILISRERESRYISCAPKIKE